MSFLADRLTGASSFLATQAGILTVAILSDSKENPAVVGSVVAALVVVTYGLLEILKQLIRRKMADSDPVLNRLNSLIEVTEQVRDALPPPEEWRRVSKRVDDIHDWLDVPHPFNPGFRAFADRMRETQVQVEKQQEVMNRDLKHIRVELDRMQPTDCPLVDKDKRRPRNRGENDAD